MPVTINGNGSISGLVIATGDIANGAVTLPKMADVATATVLGRTTAGTGVPEAMTGAQARAVVGADNASNLTSGTLPDARFPATLPAASGVNLTALNASNLGSGTVPTARLASGSATSSTYLRGDQTWATVSGGVTSLNGETGAITNTNLYAIGGYTIGRPENTTSYTVNSTVAGSSLFAAGVNAVWSPCGWNNNNGATRVNTGTWRCVSPAPAQTNSAGWPGLWVRIS